jgi:hypothetical protein
MRPQAIGWVIVTSDDRQQGVNPAESNAFRGTTLHKINEYCEVGGNRHGQTPNQHQSANSGRVGGARGSLGTGAASAYRALARQHTGAVACAAYATGQRYGTAFDPRWATVGAL